MAHVDAPAAARAQSGLFERVKDVLRPLEPYFPSVARAPSWRPAFAVLEQHGFWPRTIFDIGVGFGTWGLYRAFPSAYYHLVDPTQESRPYMEQLSKRLRCEIHSLALGDHEGHATLEIRADIQGSTLLEEVGPRDVLRFDHVRVRRFDKLFVSFERPTLCKIDVQGAEMMVLSGMGEKIAEIDVFIVETSTIATVKGGAEMAEVVRFMQAHGFVVADIVGMKRRPLDGATAQVDLMFVREDAALRSDRRWAKTA